jgi:insertion element IS1 protein InsB
MLPSKRHRITEKGSGETNHIERLNNTLRQRVSRLVRKTLAFSKKEINLLGAVLCFIDAYLAAL